MHMLLTGRNLTVRVTAGRAVEIRSAGRNAVLVAREMTVRGWTAGVITVGNHNPEKSNIKL